MRSKKWPSLYHFVLDQKNETTEEFPQIYCLGEFFFHCGLNTTVDFSEEGDRSVLLFGDLVHTKNRHSQHLAREILENVHSLNDLSDFEYNLGGKYIILYKTKYDVVLLPDATCSIPVFYSSNEKCICSDRCEYIAKRYGFKEDKTLRKIRDLSDIAQAMPYNTTTYSEVLALLPNHFLSVITAKINRIIVSNQVERRLSPQEATDIVLPRIQAITDYYVKKYDVCCPLTGGRDSRVVLSFLTQSGYTPLCYTIVHNRKKLNDPDYELPRRLTQRLGIRHDDIFDKELPKSLKHYEDAYIGAGKYSLRTLMIANTVHEYCKGKAIINGDIIGQVGKCSLHRNIPEFLATKRYFRCKMHNYSHEALEYIKKWIKEIDETEEKVNLFDLFSVENRMGRWANQENQVYNSIGQIYLNIFNSRSIIYTWTRVDREQRANGELHYELLRRNNRAYLEIPFRVNGSFLEGIARSTWVSYYVSSLLKYCYERCLFMIRRLTT